MGRSVGALSFLVRLAPLAAQSRGKLTSLDLNTAQLPRTQLPASAFPNPADAYVCDKCGRDVTINLHRGQAHVWRPMGPERYQCRCGEKYLSGATEWDHLGDWERRRRIEQTFGLAVLSPIAFSIPGVVACFAMHRSKAGLVIALLITAFPFVLIQAPFWVGVSTSMWRTRMGSSIASERT